MLRVLLMKSSPNRARPLIENTPRLIKRLVLVAKSSKNVSLPEAIQSMRVLNDRAGSDPSLKWRNC
jgi:hypothetical protein